MKKLLTVLLVLTMLVGVFTLVPASADTVEVWDGTESASLEGAGTLDNPYKISSGKDLAFLATKINNNVSAYRTAYYELTADIVLNEGDASTWAVTAPANKNYVSIGKWQSAFGGTFDGNGHTISGLYINTTADGQGLFGVIQGGATIKNFALVNSYIQAGNSNDGGASGAIVGQTDRGSGDDVTIEKIYTDAIVESFKEVGGIIGNISGTSGDYVPGDVNITDVVFDGSIHTTKGYTAGILGNGRDATIKLTNCANYGKVASDNKNVAGLLVGEKGRCEITNCINLGKVEGSANTCALVTYTKTSAESSVEEGERSVENCYYLDGSAPGATKNADGSETITVITDIMAELVGEDATLTVEGFSKRAGDIMVPTALLELAPSTADVWTKEYTVIWKNGDEVLATETYKYGEMPTYKGEEPTKADDEKYIFHFNGWTAELVMVTSDVTYYADFYRTRKSTDDEVEEDNADIEQKPAETTPQTEAPTTETEAAAGGCGGIIGGTAVALVAVIGLGAVAIRKKED